ncbi:uncharacterized protein LOC135931491 isoform X2 [Gordionus sp. m RMFG-2023]|uniref:uncharacterized protein LOC135931491 isoform X2 n=1 Tax=Gordionus sp. m RMFG-2023 TaxID=3053472 RepID=UPI0031FDB235
MHHGVNSYTLFHLKRYKIYKHKTKYKEIIEYLNNCYEKTCLRSKLVTKFKMREENIKILKKLGQDVISFQYSQKKLNRRPFIMVHLLNYEKALSELPKFININPHPPPRSNKLLLKLNSTYDQDFDEISEKDNSAGTSSHDDSVISENSKINKVFFKRQKSLENMENINCMRHYLHIKTPMMAQAYSYIVQTSLINGGLGVKEIDLRQDLGLDALESRHFVKILGRLSIIKGITTSEGRQMVKRYVPSNMSIDAKNNPLPEFNKAETDFINFFKSTNNEEGLRLFKQDKEKMIYTALSLNRLLELSQYIHTHRVIGSQYCLASHLRDKESQNNIAFKMCLKTLYKLVSKLAEFKIVKLIKLALSSNNDLQTTIVCDASVPLDDPLIVRYTSEIKLLFLSQATDKRLKDGGEQNLIHENIEINASIQHFNEKILTYDKNARILRGVNEIILNPTSKIQVEPTNLYYGREPRMIRCGFLHQYLLYLNQIELLQDHISPLQPVKEPKIYYSGDNNLYPWRKYIPFKAYKPKSRIAEMEKMDIQTVVDYMPLSLFIATVFISWKVDGLENYFCDKDKKHYLVSHLPTKIQEQLFVRRKYLRNVVDCILCLVTIGLVELDKSGRIYSKFLVQPYPCATLIDTRMSLPGHFTIKEPFKSSKKVCSSKGDNETGTTFFPHKHYDFFRDFEDPHRYWEDVKFITSHTSLRQMRSSLEIMAPGNKFTTDNVTESKDVGTAYVINVFLSQLMKLYSDNTFLFGSPREFDCKKSTNSSECYLPPGDNLGTCGFDSKLRIHGSNNWELTIEDVKCRNNYIEQYKMNIDDVAVKRKKEKSNVSRIKFRKLEKEKKKSVNGKSISFLPLHQQYVRSLQISRKPRIEKMDKVAKNLKKMCNLVALFGIVIEKIIFLYTRKARKTRTLAKSDLIYHYLCKLIESLGYYIPPVCQKQAYKKPGSNSDFVIMLASRASTFRFIHHYRKLLIGEQKNEDHLTNFCVSYLVTTKNLTQLFVKYNSSSDQLFYYLMNDLVDYFLIPVEIFDSDVPIRLKLSPKNRHNAITSKSYSYEAFIKSLSFWDEFQNVAKRHADKPLSLNNSYQPPSAILCFDILCSHVIGRAFDQKLPYKYTFNPLWMVRPIEMTKMRVTWNAVSAIMCERSLVYFKSIKRIKPEFLLNTSRFYKIIKEYAKPDVLKILIDTYIRFKFSPGKALLQITQNFDVFPLRDDESDGDIHILTTLKSSSESENPCSSNILLDIGADKNVIKKSEIPIKQLIIDMKHGTIQGATTEPLYNVYDISSIIISGESNFKRILNFQKISLENFHVQFDNDDDKKNTFQNDSGKISNSLSKSVDKYKDIDSIPKLVAKLKYVPRFSRCQLAPVLSRFLGQDDSLSNINVILDPDSKRIGVAQHKSTHLGSRKNDPYCYYSARVKRLLMLEGADERIEQNDLKYTFTHLIQEAFFVPFKLKIRMKNECVKERYKHRWDFIIKNDDPTIDPLTYADILKSIYLDIDTSGQKGVSEKELLGKYGSDHLISNTKRKVPEILHKLIHSGFVFMVGIMEVTYVTLKHISHWSIDITQNNSENFLVKNLENYIDCSILFSAIFTSSLTQNRSNEVSSITIPKICKFVSQPWLDTETLLPPLVITEDPDTKLYDTPCFSSDPVNRIKCHDFTSIISNFVFWYDLVYRAGCLPMRELLIQSSVTLTPSKLRYLLSFLVQARFLAIRPAPIIHSFPLNPKINPLCSNKRPIFRLTDSEGELEFERNVAEMFENRANRWEAQIRDPLYGLKDNDSFYVCDVTVSPIDALKFFFRGLVMKIDFG